MPQPEKPDDVGFASWHEGAPRQAHPLDRSFESSSWRIDRSSLAGSLSGLQALDPGFVDLVEEATKRILGGETVDVEKIVERHPAWAEALRGLLPAMHSLAELADVGDDLPEVGRDEQGRAVFGNFRILREVGRGGMGIVYEAEQVALKRRVALKVLPQASAMDPRALQRFQLEAQVAGWLQHSRIVPVHDVGLVQGVPYYAMQFVEGGSLADLVAEVRQLVERGQVAANPSPSSSESLSAVAAGFLNGRLAPHRREPESSRAGSQSTRVMDHHDASGGPSLRNRGYLCAVAGLGVQAAEALGYAHDQGVVHRDIKPANLLVDLHGELWVADFGMADVQGDAGLTVSGDLPGTLRYMSPEQALGKRALVDRRTDIYSLGATLYEILTLRPADRGRRSAGDFPEDRRGGADAAAPPEPRGSLRPGDDHRQGDGEGPVEPVRDGLATGRGPGTVPRRPADPARVRSDRWRGCGDGADGSRFRRGSSRRSG